MDIRKVVDTVLGDSELYAKLVVEMKTGRPADGGYALYNAVVTAMGREPNPMEGAAIVLEVGDRLILDMGRRELN